MIYRTEHPKPQFERKTWQNLNGKWDFEIDYGASGEWRNLFDETASFSKTINVPFCPESKLSGVHHLDYMNAVWYKREFEITNEQLNGLVFLHFGAVDYETTVYINGQKCGTHKGGYSSFRFDVTSFLRVGKNIVTVCAKDETRGRMIPRGKQSYRGGSFECIYTRVTGIWQTVWLEFTPKTHIEKVKYFTDISSDSVSISATLCGAEKLTAEVFFEGKEMGKITLSTCGGVVNFSIPLKEKHLWELGKGRLYDVVLTYGEDVVKSYFGIRNVCFDKYKFLFNGQSVFQRLVLDQGYYPDGIYTAPSDEALEADIIRAMDLGFNGARLHEKVFEERFLYHCDRHGYMVWGEYGNWGLDVSYPDSIYGILPEWIEVVERDFNHPSIVTWCPFNETWDHEGRKQFDPVIELVYNATKAIDPTRPCVDTSGAYHVKTDVFDIHNYDEHEIYMHLFDQLKLDGTYVDKWNDRQQFKKGTPFIVSEYGAMHWTDDPTSWGYNVRARTEEELFKELTEKTDVLLDNPYICGFCYTQLYDVEQEQNGLYTYDRKIKFKKEKISPIFSKSAAIEK